MNNYTTCAAADITEVAKKIEELRKQLPEPEFELIVATKEVMCRLCTLSLLQVGTDLSVAEPAEIFGIPVIYSSQVFIDIDACRHAIDSGKKVLTIKLDAGELKALIIDGGALGKQMKKVQQELFGCDSHNPVMCQPTSLYLKNIVF